MNKVLLFLFLLFSSLLIIATSDSYAGSVPPPVDLGEGSGCSALSSPDVDCIDLDVVVEDGIFCGTMGKKGIQVRSNDSNDADTDGESDGIEECICDAIDNNPNININPGDGSVCDSSDTNQRDQFRGSLSLGPKLQGQKYEFCYDFTSFPNLICPQSD